jgi:glycosyltransferase involved in cell wall biosynthesis
MPKILVVTDDTLSETMAGPGIRAFEMAKAISEIAEVKLVSTVPTELAHDDFSISFATRKQLKIVVDWCDVLVFQGALLSTNPWIAKTNKVIVCDLYDPMQLEVLEQLKNIEPGRRYLETLDIISVMNDQLLRGDYFICASEKQKDFWIGQLAALGRINPYSYDRDTSLKSLIDIVPFGIQDTAPNKTKSGIRGVIPGISKKDKVIIWGGGIYNWFDPLTLIKAVGQLSANHDDIRLVFMGTQHPNPHVPEMKMSFSARELSSQLGLTDKHVFFNEGWVPYDQRANFLLDADLGVSTHLDHLETSFSFRTRILDYLWAGLPIVSTQGDTFEAIIEVNNLGITVPPGDVIALEKALESILYSKKTHSLFEKSVNEYSNNLRWKETLKPLLAFISSIPEKRDSKDVEFVRNLDTFQHLGRRTLKQRIFMFYLSSKKMGFSYTFGLFYKNLKRKIQGRKISQ